MHHWREKVADKLSRLLADSPSTQPQSPRTPSQALDATDHRNQSQALPTEDSTSSITSTISSYLLSFVPSTSSGSDTSALNNGLGSPVNTFSNRWKINGFEMPGPPPNEGEGSGTESESDEMVFFSPLSIDHFAERQISGYVPEEPSTSQVSSEFLSYLTEKSTFISQELFNFFQSCLPNIVKGCQWVLLYSTLKHGTSLRTLLRNSIAPPGPCLLIVGDMQGAIFGGLLDSPLKPTAKRKYQGTNHTFVFTTIYGEPRLFRATGANRYYYLCLNNLLAFGGGGNFALCLEEDLLHGSSGPCETFQNSCLAHSPEFELKNVELWGFTHSSRYLT